MNPNRVLMAMIQEKSAAFQGLAQAWLSSGASSYIVTIGNVPVFRLPADGDEVVTLRAPIRAGKEVVGEVGIAGLDGAGSRPRLLAEADLVSTMLEMATDSNQLVAELSEAQDQLLAIYELGRSMGSQIEIEKAVAALTGRALHLTKAEAAFTYFAFSGQPAFLSATPSNLLTEKEAADLFRRVSDAGESLLIPAPAAGPGANLCAAPISISRRTVGVLGLLFGRPVAALSPDIKLSQAIARQAETYLENALLHRDAVRQAELRTEVDLARSIQFRLVPQRMPHLPGLDLSAGMRPAKRMGGDFYDIVAERRRSPILCVGDVAGKGMSAALMMSMTHMVIRSAARFAPQRGPMSLLQRVNQDLYDDLTEVGLFVTAFIAQYDAGERRIQYANAGHSPVIYCPRGGPARLLEAASPPIGVVPDCRSEQGEVRMAPGDLLVMATDGLSEASGPDGEMFGYERLLELVASLADRPARAVADALSAAVASFEAGQAQNDDQTLMVCRGIPV